MNIAILTAGGVGSRMHCETPKQFIHINDKPIIIHTMEVFQQHPSIDAIIVAVLEGWQDVLKDYIEEYRITKCKWIVGGGKTGQESVFNCLKKLQDSLIDGDSIIIIHDGNRPLVTSDIIDNSLATYYTYGSAITAIPTVEAVFRSKDDKTSVETIERNELFRTQTPHVYNLKKLLWAHEEAKKRNIKDTAATCVLMNKLGEKIYFSSGSEKNIKITTQDDLELFKALLNLQGEK